MTNEELIQALRALQAQMAELQARVAEFEKPAPAIPAPELMPPPAPPPREEPAETEITEEILLAISAAVAAYLGERAHIRAVRLISTSRWSQEGRVSIQASHRLERG